MDDKAIIFSCVIPVKDVNDPKLADLISSIKAQDFPQDQIEILTITEGDSERAKGIGIKRAKGEIIGMFCADNNLIGNQLFKGVRQVFNTQPGVTGVYPKFYHYSKDDNSLNRYFSLIGGNDPVCYYLGKNDRWPHVPELRKTSSYPASFGCNGFFYRSERIKNTNLDHYYPMDNALEVGGYFWPMGCDSIWHRTSDNLFTFLKKRYKYARDLYCDRNDRRWKMLDTREDYWRLGLFIGSVLFIFPCFLTSIRGFIKVKDWAWFWHWPVCFGFLITYGILAIRNLFKYGRLFQCPQAPLSSRPLAETKV